MGGGARECELADLGTADRMSAFTLAGQRAALRLWRRLTACEWAGSQSDWRVIVEWMLSMSTRI